MITLTCMGSAPAGLVGLLLLCAPPEPAERYLNQQEWHAEILFRRSESKSTASSHTSKDWRARVTFRMTLNKVDALIHSRERELRNPRKDLPPAAREAYEEVRQSYVKALGLGTWMGDMKQTEELWLTETSETLSRCGGGCGDRSCRATGSKLERRTGHIKRGEGDIKPPPMDKVKSFADINAVAGINLNTLSIDTRRKTLDFKVNWNKSLMVDVLRTVRKPHGPSAPESVPPEVGTLVFPEIAVKDYPLPDEGATLHGSIPIKDDQGRYEVGEIVWSLSPKPLPPVDLRVDLEDYDHWRPEGSSSEGEPGNEIAVRTWLEAPGGGAVEDKAKTFWFLLKDVTTQPGTCLNFPPNPRLPPDLDLKFLPDSNGGPVVLIGGVPCAEVRTDTSARAEAAEGKSLIGAIATISAFDWGAFGILEVRAFLESGRMLYGELRGQPGRTQIRIPKSDDGSWIADGWKEKTGATGADDSDDEREPAGNARYPGDGLTLYEEYRGWHEGGARLRDEFDGGGDPKKKELFICDDSGVYVLDALRQFQQLTGLRVIWNLKRSEISDGRVINFNHGGKAPHAVDQHAVVMTFRNALMSPLSVRDAHETGTPGSRGTVTVREIPSGPVYQQGAGLQSNRTRMIVHDLLHSCNVKDHGTYSNEEVTGVLWSLGRDDRGTPWLMEGTQRIRVMMGTQDVTDFYIAQLRGDGDLGPYARVRIGAWQGASAGNPCCVMAYPAAPYARSRRDRGLRYLIRREVSGLPAGLQLCDGPLGTHFNASNHSPEAYLGPAASGRGDCVHQIVVNDAARPR